MLGTCCYLVNTQNPVPSWSSQYTIRQPFKSTLLTKSIQSMCKYRLCNLDSQRSLHIAKGAISSLRNHALLKLLTYSRIFYCHYVMDKFDFFCDDPKSLNLPSKESPCYLCCWYCFVTHLDSRDREWKPKDLTECGWNWIVLGHTTNKWYLQNQSARVPDSHPLPWRAQSYIKYSVCIVWHKILYMYFWTGKASESYASRIQIVMIA